MDLATLNLIRKGNGQEPLDKLPEDLGGEKTAAAAAGAAAETKTPEQIEAERKLAEEEANKGKGGDAGATATKKLTDEELIAILNERGANVTSLEDLKKKEPVDPALLAEKREADEIAFGLSGGHFNKKEYDLFVTDAAAPTNLVFEEFFNETKAGNPDATDEQIQEEFNSTYGLDKEKDSYQYKRGIKLIKERAISLMKSKHGKIFDAKTAFSGTEKDRLAASETQKKVAAALPAYTQDVASIVAELKKITVKVSDDESIDLDDNDELMSGIAEQLMDPQYYTGKLASGYKKEDIRNAVVAGFLAKNFSTLTTKVAKKYFEKHKAGTHGVPPGGAGAAKVVDMTGLTDAQKKYVELNRLEAERQAK